MHIDLQYENCYEPNWKLMEAAQELADFMNSTYSMKTTISGYIDANFGDAVTVTGK